MAGVPTQVGDVGTPPTAGDGGGRGIGSAGTRSKRAALAVLALATAAGSTGLAAGGTATPLLAARLAGPEAAGLPLGFLVVGSAVGALVISARTSRAGRGSGLIRGYAAGALGAIAVIVGGVVGSFAVVLGGSFLLGGANAAVFLTRYAAADLGGAEARGRALGMVFFATAAGAVVSPNLLGPSGQLARVLGLPELTGLFVIAVASFALAGLILARLCQVVRDLAVKATLLRPAVAGTPLNMGIAAVVRGVPARIALLVLATSNLVMVAIMAVAPLHLIAHGHGLNFVGLVVSVHVAGMFAPSLLTGWLADRVGAATVAALGTFLLISAGIAATLLDLAAGPTMLIFLAVVGVAWNAGVVGGSALLSASVSEAARPRSEGLGEVAMGLAAAVGAPAAGLIVALGGLGTLGIAGALAAAFSLPVIVLAARRATPATVRSG